MPICFLALSIPATRSAADRQPWTGGFSVLHANRDAASRWPGDTRRSRKSATFERTVGRREALTLTPAKRRDYGPQRFVGLLPRSKATRPPGGRRECGDAAALRK